MRNYQSKPCAVCGVSFTPVTGKQFRCPECSAKGLRPDKAPPCGCGCGQPVKWKKGKWNKYLAGHHVRLNNPSKKGKPAWNKGNGQETRQCLECHKPFTTRDKRKKYCSPECYHKHATGENNALWTGGRPKTKYQWVSVNGRYLRKHRAIMEEVMGRRLYKREVVHHIDRDGLNNNPENLHLFHCDSCHLHHHKTGAPLAYEYPHKR